jgi:hypothetical protein
MDYLEDILGLVKKKMREQGAYDREAYEEFVVETIGYFEEKGKLTPEDNQEFLKDQLMEMWDTVEEELASER